jgi:hypothetical protein
MRVPFFYDQPIIPENFKFPNRYIDISHGKEKEISDPWKFMFKDPVLSIFYLGSMLIKFSDHPLIPFAIAEDGSGLYNDGSVIVSCFDGLDQTGSPKIFFYNYAIPKKKISDLRQIGSFDEWLEYAKREAERYRRMSD